MIDPSKIVAVREPAPEVELDPGQIVVLGEGERFAWTEPPFTPAQEARIREIAGERRLNVADAGEIARAVRDAVEISLRDLNRRAAP